MAILAIMRTGELMASVQRLEDSLKADTQQSVALPAAALAPQSAPVQEAPAESSPPPTPTQAPVPPQAARIPTDDAPIASSPWQQPSAFSAGATDTLQRWIVKSWAYVVAGVSLALSGIFFVQYGIEHGILSPAARVLSGGGFGLGLIGAAVYLHRRSGDDSEGADVLPSVMVGAGFVSIFAATLAARQLYGLIGPELALALHVIAAIAAIAFGWVFGPMLIGLGLAGGFVAPLIVGGHSDAPDFLYAYYVLLAAIGLGVDYMRRWGWVSVLALGLGYLGVALIGFGLGSEVGFIAALVAVAILAVTLPSLRFLPDLDGSSLSETLFLGAAKPGFAVQLAMGANLATTLFVMKVAMTSLVPTAWVVLALLALAYSFWLRAAPALTDAMVVPSAALLFLLAAEITAPTALSRGFLAQAAAEIPAPLTVTLMLAGAALLSLAFAYLARRGGALSPYFAFAAALYAPLATLLLDRGFHPAIVLGAYPWGLHVMALAGVMVGLAYHFGQVGQRRGMAYSALSALALIALAMVTVMSGPALTLALAALISAAAWLGRRFSFAEMAWFATAALAAVSYRLLVAPGLPWAVDTPLLAVISAFGGTLLALLLARHWTPQPQAGHRMSFETAAMSFAAVLIDILILRTMEAQAVQQDCVRTSLLALPWLALALTQWARIAAGASFRIERETIAGLASGGAGLCLGYSVLQSPISIGKLVGPPVLDTSFVAYIIPALLMLGGMILARPSPTSRRALGGAAGALGALYLVIQVRRFWNGEIIAGAAIGQGELYTYTLVLMILGAGLIHLAIRQHSAFIRRAGMAVIALTVAKVFLWDAAGLSGLTRVASFAGLGLALLGLAQLNRWAARKPAKMGWRKTP